MPKAMCFHCDGTEKSEDGTTPVDLCPLHAQAEAMRDLLLMVMDDDDTRETYRKEWDAIRTTLYPLHPTEG